MLSRFNVLTKEFAMRKLVALCMISASLAGCASVPMGDPARDLALKQFDVAPDKAGVYIYRNELIGRAVKMDVEVDGKPIGQTAAQSYLYRELTPGKHTVTAKAENMDSLEIDAQPGKLSFIWQEVKMGVVFARTKLHLVDEKTGRSGVMGTRLAEGL